MVEKKTFIRKIKQGDTNRYAEVWNERKGKKIIQHHVRYLGSDPENLPPVSSFDIEKVHVGYLAQLILGDALCAEDIYTLLEGMGESTQRQDVRSVIFRYDLDSKKTRFQLIFRKGRDDVARSAGQD